MRKQAFYTVHITHVKSEQNVEKKFLKGYFEKDFGILPSWRAWLPAFLVAGLHMGVGRWGICPLLACGIFLF